MDDDLKEAVNMLTRKKAYYDLLWRYYDGDQPLVYSSKKLREIFSGLNARFTENWCAVVVDSVLDRMELQTPSVPDAEDTNALLENIWEVTGLVDDEYGIHESVAVVGEAFVIAWPNEDTGEIEAFLNDARMCCVYYDDNNPKIKRYAAKWWRDENLYVRLNLYYVDHIEYYITRNTVRAGEVPEPKSFVPAETPTAPNPYGIIPVFHFQANRRTVKSQLDNVVPIQDMVNKLISDMMVAAEFAAYAQRWVISQAGISGLKNRPFGIWDLPAADAGGGQPTSAGEFSPTPLSNFLDPINKLSSDIGIISRTPKHYFFAQGGDPSGEALIVEESALTKKCDRLQSTLSPAWRDLAAFLLLLSGVVVPTQAVTIDYMPSGTVQPKTESEIRKNDVSTGLPLRTVLRREGWTEEEITQMEQDKADEKAAQATYASSVLAQQQTLFDQGMAVQ